MHEYVDASTATWESVEQAMDEALKVVVGDIQGNAANAGAKVAVIRHRSSLPERYLKHFQKGLSVKEAAEAEGVTYSAARFALIKLEQMGLVSRE